MNSDLWYSHSLVYKHSFDMWLIPPATDRVTGHARGCAFELSCLKLECMYMDT